MSEEIKRESELSEATLEQVSGGVNLPNDPRGRAAQICVWCFKRTHGQCPGRPDELAAYMREHGLFDGCGACPF